MTGSVTTLTALAVCLMLLISSKKQAIHEDDAAAKSIEKFIGFTPGFTVLKEDA